MELDELKKVWKKEKEELKERIRMDEELIHRLSINSSKSTFGRMLNTSIWGRNLALVYMSISLVTAAVIYEDWPFSVPIFLGGLAMLFSFVQHLKLEKVDFARMTTVDLQKAVSQFRIHTAKHAVYDVSIVSFWACTLMPVYVRYSLHLPFTFAQLIPVMLLMIALIAGMSFLIYRKWNRQLKENEDNLNQVIEFEKE